MIIKKQELLHDLGHLVRVYRTFNPELYYVVSPFCQPVQFSDPEPAFDFAYSLYCENVFGGDD